MCVQLCLNTCEKCVSVCNFSYQGTYELKTVNSRFILLKKTSSPPQSDQIGRGNKTTRRRHCRHCRAECWRVLSHRWCVCVRNTTQNAQNKSQHNTNILFGVPPRLAPHVRIDQDRGRGEFAFGARNAPPATVHTGTGPDR